VLAEALSVRRIYARGGDFALGGLRCRALEIRLGIETSSSISILGRFRLPPEETRSCAAAAVSAFCDCWRAWGYCFLWRVSIGPGSSPGLCFWSKLISGRGPGAWLSGGLFLLAKCDHEVHARPWCCSVSWFRWRLRWSGSFGCSVNTMIGAACNLRVFSWIRLDNRQVGSGRIMWSRFPWAFILSSCCR